MGALDGLTLHSTLTSPFARRVRIALRRLAIAHDEVFEDTSKPASKEWLALNPLGLVPFLVPRGQEPIVDSTLILDFLDDHTAQVWPKELMERWAAKRMSALAVGIMTDAVAWRRESLDLSPRPSVLRDREERIVRTFGQMAGLERKRSHWWRKPNQALFDIGIAVEFCALRLPHLDSEVEKALDGTDESLWERLDEEESFGDTRPPGLGVRGT